ncbi:MAG: hypothetical protein AAGF95_13515 [Chloroflexota bacterium]
MSKLFACNASQTTEEFEVDGRYDHASQLWVGSENATAGPAGISCNHSSLIACNVSKDKNHGGCSRSWCWQTFAGDWCYTYWC